MHPITQPRRKVSQIQTERVLVESPEFAESKRFYTSLGYPQYAGKYATFKLPSKHKVVSIKETSEGLSIELISEWLLAHPKPSEDRIDPFIVKTGVLKEKFAPFITESRQREFGRFELVKGWVEQRYIQEQKLFQEQQELARQLQLEYEQQKYESQLFWIAHGYPQFAGKYAPFEIPYGYSIGLIKPKEEGLDVTFKMEPWFNPKTGKPYAKADFPIQELPVMPLELAKKYPKTFETLYGTKIPEGYELETLTETPSGLKFTFAPLQQPQKGIAETLAPYTTKPLLSYFGIKQYTDPLGQKVTWITGAEPKAMKHIETVHPLTLLAGLIALFEATAYTVGQVARIETPSIPPTFFSFQHGKAMEYGWEYAAGTIVGDILLSMALGKAISKTWKYTPKVIKKPLLELKQITGEALGIREETQAISRRIKNWLLETQYKPSSGWFIKEGIPSQAKIVGGWTWKAKVIMRLTGIKPYLPYGEISIPVVETVEMRALASGIPYTSLGWQLTEAPRMGGVFITKVPTETTMKALELFFGLGTQLISFRKIEGAELSFKKETILPTKKIEKGLPSSILEESYYPHLGGFEKTIEETNVRGLFSWRKWPTIKDLMAEQKLLPFTTQTQVTRMGITPYIPKVESMDFGFEMLSQTLGFGVVTIPKIISKPTRKRKVETLPKLKPKIFEESFPIQKLRLFPMVYPKQKQKEKAISIPKISSAQLPTLTQKVAQVQIAKQLQKLSPTITKTTVTAPPFPTTPTLPHKFEDSEPLRKDLSGKWFKRTHLLPTEKEIRKRLGFTTKRSNKKWKL